MNYSTLETKTLIRIWHISKNAIEHYPEGLTELDYQEFREIAEEIDRRNGVDE